MVRAVLVLLILAGAGLAIWYIWARPSVRAERLLSRARTLRLAGEREQAEHTAAAALRLDNRLWKAALLAAECAAADGDPERAVDYLLRSRSHDPEVRVRTALFAAELYHKRLFRFAEAEKHYRAVLKLDSEHIDANTGLARLLGLCARRDEAVPHILRLLRQGHPTDLLILLGRESGVVHDLDALQGARQAAPDDPNPLVGLAWHAANDGEHDQAIDLLRDALRLKPDHVAAYAALGRRLFEARRVEELARWARGALPAAEESAAVWLVRARMAEHDGDARVHRRRHRRARF